MNRAYEAAPGTVVGGRYRIDAPLGSGGFGAVYVATQLGLDRPVALKLLHRDVLARPDALQRFEREARLVQALQHPNVVQTYDFGTSEWGQPFIVFELLRGRTLDRLLAETGPLSDERSARIARQVLKALMEAHARGIVHRDIKPANVHLSSFAGEPDFVKLLDFGIAAVPMSGSQGLTAEGTSLGTPEYMAPEQVLDHPVDARTDLYAFGLVLAEMIQGAPIMAGGSSMRVAVAQADASPVPLPPSVLASPLGPIVARATQKEPSRRFASAAEMLEWIDRAGPFGTLPSHPMSVVEGRLLGSAPTQAAPAAWGPTTGAVVVPRRPSTQPGGLRPWMVIGALAAMLTLGAVLVVGAFAAGVLTASDGLPEGAGEGNSTRARGSKYRREDDRDASGDPSSADTPSIEPDAAALDPLDDFPILPKSSLPCKQSNPALVGFTIRGLEAKEIVERITRRGHPCTVQNTMGRCVQVMFPGSGDHDTLVATFCPAGGRNSTGTFPGAFFIEDEGRSLAIFSTPNRDTGEAIGRAIFDDAGAAP
jgi:hypothetical protein